ncbi:MAG: hypothetical protein M1820_007885 [Bogoriella megaspora]|nr:MAG: hypothetical protein M1820_007885 [Bogoriella megaspora]
MADSPSGAYQIYHAADRIHKSSPSSHNSGGVSSQSPQSNPQPDQNSASNSQNTNGGSHSHHANTTSSSGSGSSSLNPRSCVTCRRRKVKCDKKHPCSNCTRAHIDCIYPAPGRAPRKVKKAQDGDLMDRLRRLEGIVKSLEPDMLENDGKGGSRQGSVAVGGKGGEKERDAPEKSDEDSPEESGGKPWSPVPPFNEALDAAGAPMFYDKMDGKTGQFENRFGRLVIHDGKSRYVNNSFWASLSNEVEDLKGILNEDTEDEEEGMSPTTPHSQLSSELQGFIFGYSSSNVDMSRLHPPRQSLPLYIKIFKENVDPVVKILHMPSTEPILMAQLENLHKLPKGLEVLFFSIYYAAITSLTQMECREHFGEERSALLERYQFAVQQALARANFLVTEEIVVLQAFALFLLCLRRNDDARTIWTLTGLIVRIAQTLGIHRDGSHFNLSPFETEMRRRLWWQVCILDSRASEDHGCDPTVIDQLFDTKMPLNVNDDDLSPEMTELPEPRVGFTEMTFSLIRCEVTSTFRRINYVPPGPKTCFEKFANATFEDKKKWITECHQRLEEQYLQYCDMTVPLYWVTATVCRLIMAKMWLMIYHPFQRKDGGRSLPQDVKDKLFLTSLENIEYMLLLETEARTMKWGWLIKTYVQWHALAFLLTELCVRTKGPMVTRAWAAIEKTMKNQCLTHSNDKRGHLWKPLRKLWAKAKAMRAKELEKEQITVQQARSNIFGEGLHTTMLDQSLFADPQKFSSDPAIGTSWASMGANSVSQFQSSGQSYIDELDNQQERLRKERQELEDTHIPIDPSVYDIEPQSHSQSAMPSNLRNSILSSPSSATIDAAMDNLNNAAIFGPLAGQGNTPNPPRLNNLSHPSSFPSETRNQDSQNTSRPQTSLPRSDTIDSIPYDTMNPDLASFSDSDIQMNWASFDDMVRQFGMDVDQPGQGVTSNYAPGQGGYPGMGGTTSIGPMGGGMPGMEGWW